MSGRTALYCGNCGTALDEPPPGVAGVYCTVCQLFNDLSERPPATAFTSDTLGASLGGLIAQARASGMADEEIVRVLRDELEFAAELANAGRQIFVQIIDLGPADAPAPSSHGRVRVSALRGRSLGG